MLTDLDAVNVCDYLYFINVLTVRWYFLLHTVCSLVERSLSIIKTMVKNPRALKVKVKTKTFYLCAHIYG
jgi:hypothetical protein